MRVAVVGAGGQLGAALMEACRGRHDATALAHRDLDVTDDAQVTDAIQRIKPEVIINAAAYNDVDGAEDHPTTALNVNAFAVRALAMAAAPLGATLVHYSTDFVFDGTASAPYHETDRPNPRSVYAASKLLGEWFADTAPRAYVLRVESLFGRVSSGPPSKGSVSSIVNTLRNGGTATVFDDRVVTPTYIIDAAAATMHLIEHAATPGIYHCVNSGACTWFELATEVARVLGCEPRLKPIRMSEVRLRAARPRYCALSNDKLRSAGFAMPGWQDALARYLAGVRDEIGHDAANRKR